MRVEQRIGRIDRIGQRHDVVWIRNYFYEKSVEAEVYRRLEDRINWFETVVGALQPILTSVGRTIQQLSMTDPKARRAGLDRELDSIRDQLAERDASGLDIDAFAIEEPVAPDIEPEPVTAEQLEELLVQSSSLGGRFEAHPEIEGAYEVVNDGETRAVTFRRDVFDTHPDTVRLLTFGEPLLDSLLAEAGGPTVSDAGGRVQRCEAEPGGHVAYYAPEGNELLLLRTLDDLRRVLAAPSTISDQVARDATKDIQERVGLLLQREADVHGQLAAGELLARKEEARVLLRKATCVDYALRRFRTGMLFEPDERQLSITAFGPAVVREFARRKGHPYAPLLVAIDREAIPLAATDPYFVAVRGESEATLVARERRLRERANELLGDVVAAKARFDDVADGERPPAVQTLHLS